MRRSTARHVMNALASVLVIFLVSIFVLASSADASDFCFGRDTNRKCYPKFFFWNTQKTKPVDRSFLKYQWPQNQIITDKWGRQSTHYNKYWPRWSDQGTGWWGYCNSNICIKDLKMPRLEMKEREGYKGSGINIHFGLYGETGDGYWYIRKNKDYPSDGELDNYSVNKLTPDDAKDARGLKGAELPLGFRYCPGDMNGNWDWKFDVTLEGGMANATASESDHSQCIDSKKVLVARNGSNWEDDPDSPIKKYIFLWLEKIDKITFLFYDTWPSAGYKCKNPNILGACRYDAERIETFYGRCPCDMDHNAPDCAGAPSIQDNVANYQCVDEYRAGYRQVDRKNAPVYQWRYRTVDQVPRLIIDKLLDNEKTSYRAKSANEPWDYGYQYKYIIYYGGEKVARPPLPAIQVSVPKYGSPLQCAKDIINVQRKTDENGVQYFDYEIHAEGHNKNAYEFINGLSKDQREEVIKALANTLHRDIGQLKGASSTEITFLLSSLQDADRTSIKQQLGNIFTDDQYALLFGTARVVGQQIQALAENSAFNEGYMCRATLTSPFGTLSEYVYFTGMSSLPPPKIFYLRAAGTDESDEISPAIVKQTKSSQALVTSMAGSRSPAEPFLTIYALKGSNNEVIQPHEKLVLYTYSEQTAVDISWNTEHAQKLELIKYTNHDINNKDISDVSGPVGYKKFDNLQINTTYSFVFIATNNRGPPTPEAWQDTSFVHAQRIDVEIKPVPIEIFHNNGRLNFGKKKCQGNVQGWQTPKECIELSWRIKGKPKAIIIRWPKGGDHNNANEVRTTAGSVDKIKTADINRALTRFKIEASRGSVKAEKDIVFSQGPQDFLTVLVEGWADGNYVRYMPITELFGWECNEDIPIVGSVCKHTSIGNLLTPAKHFIILALAPVSGPIGGVVINALEPIIFGLIGAIGNMFNAQKSGGINGAGDQADYELLLSQALPNLLTGVLAGMVSAIFGCEIAKTARQIVQYVLSGMRLLFKLFGWDFMGCPQGKEKICATGSDVGASVGYIIGGMLTGELFGKQPPSCEEKKKTDKEVENEPTKKPTLVPPKPPDFISRFTGDIGHGWETLKEYTNLNDFHNRLASNAFQQFCRDATNGSKTIDRTQSMKALIGTENPRDETTGGLRTKDIGLFHCLWTVYEQSGYDTSQLNYNGTYYTDADIPGSTVQRCNIQEMLSELGPICQAIIKK